MKNSIACAAALLLGVAGSVYADGSQFDFGGDLTATFGPAEAAFFGDAADYAQFGTTTDFGIAGPGGDEADVMFIEPPFAANSITVDHKSPGNAGGDYTNEYTLIYDLYLPQSSFDDFGWFGFYNTNDTNSNDGDAFIRLSDGGIGISSVYDGQIFADTWHRVAFVWELDTDTGFMDLYKYIDGVQVGVQEDLGSVDGRWSLYSTTDGDPAIDYFLLLADDSGDEAPAYISSFYFEDRPFSGSEIASLGGADADGIIPTPGTAVILGVAGLVARRRR
jgi:5'-nucleotidase/UDP-sugar diphosphatase